MSGINVESLARAWRSVRDDVNVLAWLFEEERTIQRLYIESFFWALTGKSYTVEDFAKQVGVGVADQGSAHESERSASGALESGSSSEG